MQLKMTRTMQGNWSWMAVLSIIAVNISMLAFGQVYGSNENLEGRRRFCIAVEVTSGPDSYPDLVQEIRHRLLRQAILYKFPLDDNQDCTSSQVVLELALSQTGRLVFSHLHVIELALPGTVRPSIWVRSYYSLSDLPPWEPGEAVWPHVLALFDELVFAWRTVNEP
jgi:hypothetical protein